MRMDTSAALIFFFQLVTVLGFALTAARMYYSGIYRRYRIFFAYLIFSILQISLALSMEPRSGIYLKMWIITEPFLWLFYVLVVLELYALVLERYRGIYTLGRWALYFSVAASVGLSALTLVHKSTPAGARQTSRILVYFLVIERGVVCSLLIFLFLILLILSRYPVQSSRNVIVHCVVYSGFFLSNTLVLLLRSVFGVSLSSSLSTVQLGITAMCVMLWVLFLDQKGETRLITLVRMAPDQEERILSKLSSLNATVLRAGSK